MAGIIMLLVQLFGPIIAAAFDRWLKKKLGVAAQSFDYVAQFGDAPSGLAGRAVLQKVHDDLPRFAIARRFLMQRLIAQVDPTKDIPTSLPTHAVDELTAVGAFAEAHE